MPEQDDIQTEDQLDEQDSTQPKRGLMAKLKVGSLISAIVVAELAAAYFYYGSAVDGVEQSTPIEGQPDDEETEKQDELVEFALGNFSVTTYYPLSNTTMRIDFELVGTLLEDDEDDLEELMEINKHRFREQILFIIRSSEMTDVTEAGLGLIKRKILEKSNRLLGRPILKGIVFSNFEHLEQ